MTPELLVLAMTILALINGETASGIINWLKKQLKIENGPKWKLLLLAAVEVMAVTAGYLLLVTKSFSWAAFAACSVWAFLRASGIYTDKPVPAPVPLPTPKY